LDASAEPQRRCGSQLSVDPLLRTESRHIDLSVGDPDRSVPFYTAFFADPDRVKVEVVHEPLTNP